MHPFDNWHVSLCLFKTDSPSMLPDVHNKEIYKTEEHQFRLHGFQEIKDKSLEKWSTIPSSEKVIVNNLMLQEHIL